MIYDAVQWLGNNREAVNEMLERSTPADTLDRIGVLRLDTRTRSVSLDIGDWVVIGPQGAHDVKPGIFYSHYEPM